MNDIAQTKDQGDRLGAVLRRLEKAIKASDKLANPADFLYFSMYKEDVPWLLNYVSHLKKCLLQMQNASIEMAQKLELADKCFFEIRRSVDNYLGHCEQDPHFLTCPKHGRQKVPFDHDGVCSICKAEEQDNG